MSVRNVEYVSWNPWHGCTKVSPGCRYCYVYRQDEHYGDGERARECRKTANFNLPTRRRRDGGYKVAPGSMVMTCFTSDFLLEDADGWRDECWRMIRERSDCWFYFFTKRIERLAECLPADWGDGYENVIIGCTVENQEMADRRLPVFRSLPIRHRTIIIAPMIGPVVLGDYLDGSFDEVAVSGESGLEARVLDWSWVLDVRRECIDKDVPFLFHQTGANFLKDGRRYKIPRRLQRSQARKAGINYRIGAGEIPETVSIELPDAAAVPKQISIWDEGED